MQLINNFADAIVLGSAIYHFIMGVACVVGLSFIFRAIRFLYRIQMPEKLDPRLEYMIGPLGAFALWTSGLCGLAFVFRDQMWTSYLKIFLAILFLLRAFFRFRKRDLFFKAFDVPWSRSRWNVILNIILSAILLASAGGHP